MFVFVVGCVCRCLWLLWVFEVVAMCGRCCCMLALVLGVFVAGVCAVVCGCRWLCVVLLVFNIVGCCCCWLLCVCLAVVV